MALPLRACRRTMVITRLSCTQSHTKLEHFLMPESGGVGYCCERKRRPALIVSWHDF